MLSQQPSVTPPLPSDKDLIDYSGILQRLFSTLFQAAHLHVGSAGYLTAIPTASQGSPGDIMVGVVNGTGYIFFKVDKTNWYKISAVHI